MPPASVAKIVTTLYALDALGPGFRFRTEIRAAGPVEGGVLKGDLVLAGGGDPVLDTDALGDMGGALRATGLGAVAGRFLVATGALPAVAEIDAGQPEDAPYNPTISGMNLNFNRVFLAWAPGKQGPDLALSAPGGRFEVPVSGIRAELVEEGLPRHRFDGADEVWSLPRPAFRGRGSAWLPVRAPGVNTGEVFRRLAADQGLSVARSGGGRGGARRGDGGARERRARADAPGHAALFHQPDGGGRRPRRRAGPAGRRPTGSRRRAPR